MWMDGDEDGSWCKVQYMCISSCLTASEVSRQAPNGSVQRTGLGWAGLKTAPRPLRVMKPWNSRKQAGSVRPTNQNKFLDLLFSLLHPILLLASLLFVFFNLFSLLLVSTSSSRVAISAQFLSVLNLVPPTHTTFCSSPVLSSRSLVVSLPTRLLVTSCLPPPTRMLVHHPSRGVP